MDDTILRQINTQGKVWLQQNADAIYPLLDVRQNAHVEILLQIFPYLLQREDIKRWGKLLTEALKASDVQV
ncbi:MAG: hypothetical protein OHK0046_19720 [Anaerolineae bacterium]